MRTETRRISPSVHVRAAQLFTYNLLLPQRPKFIAEIGSNHCGSYDLAIELINEAKKAGAHGVKFQLFRREDICRQPERLAKETELPPEWLPGLSKEAHNLGMAFICTPFAMWALPVLMQYVDGWKIGSFEGLHTDLIFGLPPDGKPLILSLGMMWKRNLLRILPFIKSPGLILLHCVSQYPTAYKDAGLCRIIELRNMRLRTGYSSHTAGWADVTAAACMQIVLVEKHIRLKQQPESPDNGPWALNPDEFARMIEDANNAYTARHSKFRRGDAPPGRKVFGV